MKKVVKNQQSDVINLSDVTDESIVGIQWSDESKSFLIKLESKKFAACGHSHLYLGNAWHRPSVKEYLEDVIVAGATPFVFDTLKELYQWMAK